MNKNNKDQESQANGIKILIVEDEKVLASILGDKLEKEGYDVAISYNGEEGYEKIKNWKPNLILLDIIMPKMNGYEVLEKMEDDGIKIPVIIISNSGQPVEIEKTKKLGAVDHLIKTQFEPEEVMVKIRKYLDAHGKAKVIQDAGIMPKENTDGVNKLNINVLLVEDDSFLREIISKKLFREGFTIFEAADGEQAIKNLSKANSDIILLDIILPAVDGFEVLKQIRSHKNEKIRKTPVIMLSNLGQKEDVDTAFKMGANGYLIKAHFTTEEIVNKIKMELKL